MLEHTLRRTLDMKIEHPRRKPHKPQVRTEPTEGA
jgi:hypothetical protein